VEITRSTRNNRLGREGDYLTGGFLQRLAGVALGAPRRHIAQRG
jgi:hypothetical protein